MSFLPKAIKPLFGLAGMLLGGKKKQPPMRAYGAPDQQAMAEIEANDILRRRRGSAADILTGVRGAEPAPASLGRLVIGS